MRILALAPLALLLPDAAQAQEKPDPAHLKASVEKLVSFGTRHTLSDPDNPTRGIGAARRWFAGELSKIGDRCNCIEVANIARTFTGDRAPNGVEIVDVLGFQAGTDPNRVVIVQGHIDSRVTDVMNSTSDAPGANDDGSGVALVLEAARLLSRQEVRRHDHLRGAVGRGTGADGRDNCWPTRPRSGAGRSPRCSTTTSSATRSARTARASRTGCGSSPRGSQRGR
jgi:hypothetical protein